jgi:hypothetical protein
LDAGYSLGVDAASTAIPFVPAGGARAARYADEAYTVGKGAIKGGDNTAAKIGRNAHEAVRKRAARKGWDTNAQGFVDPKTGKKVVPDAITPSGRPVELKPNTRSGLKRGKSQIRKYERATGRKGRVITYDPSKPPK